LNVDHVIELGLGHLLEVDMQRIAGIVHKVVKPFASPAFERLADLGHESIECGQNAGIEARRRCFLPIAAISRMKDSASA
jgi:hypothetical protein